MKERIPQHRHCRECGKAFAGEGKFCSDECRERSESEIARKKRQLTLLYVLSVVILIAAVVYIGVA